MIRAFLRKWLGVADPPAAKPEPKPRRLAQDALDYFGATNPDELTEYGGIVFKARKIEAPKLPPGVVPTDPALLASDSLGAYVAMDSADFAPLFTYANSVNCGLGFPGYPYLSELTQRSEFRAPAETMASEMTREWIVLKTQGVAGGEDDSDNKQADDELPPESDQNARMDDDGAPSLTGADDKIEDINAALEKHGVREMFRRIAEQDDFFGRSQLFIDIDTGSKDADVVRQLPLVIDPAAIKKGSLKGFKVIEPIWTTPYYYNASDPTADDFYKPRAWFVLGKRIHASRLLTFISREVPDLLKPAYNFGGISMSQLIEPYVFQWIRTRNAVSDLIHNFSIIALMTNMDAVLNGEQGSGKTLFDRARLFTQTRDNKGLMLLDKSTEELAQIAVPLSGLDALQAQAQEHMAAPSHIPLVKLLGITPTGLNASSEGEIKVFYDFVRARQQALFAKHLKTVIDVIQLDEFGTIDDAITFEFVPLTSPSVKELSEIRKADTDTAVALIGAGVISADEDRARLIADPNSGYTMLSGPAPEPPPTPGLDPETGEPVAGGPFAAAEEPNGPPKKETDNAQ